MTTFLFPNINVSDIDYDIAYDKLFEFKVPYGNCYPAHDSKGIVESPSTSRDFDLPLHTLRFLPISMPVPKRLMK